jgi:hypothetical protein
MDLEYPTFSEVVSMSLEYRGTRRIRSGIGCIVAALEQRCQRIHQCRQAGFVRDLPQIFGTNDYRAILSR